MAVTTTSSTLMLSSSRTMFKTRWLFTEISADLYPMKDTVKTALEGTSSSHSAITLYLAADSVEEVMFFLDDQHIPFQTHERLTRLGSKKQEYFPLLRFYADDVEVELMVFPHDERFAGAPISPITGKAMKRADRKKVAALLG